MTLVEREARSLALGVCIAGIVLDATAGTLIARSSGACSTALWCIEITGALSRGYTAPYPRPQRHRVRQIRVYGPLLVSAHVVSARRPTLTITLPRLRARSRAATRAEGVLRWALCCRDEPRRAPFPRQVYPPVSRGTGVVSRVYHSSSTLRTMGTGRADL